MIFVALGSQKFQLDRLLRELDRLVGEGLLQEEIFAQTGCSGYVPQHYASQRFLEREEFAAYVRKADVIIIHGGSGAIMSAVKQGKRVVAFPRLAAFGEHVDDHQLQLVGQFAEMNLVIPCYRCEDLLEAIREAEVHTFDRYGSSNQRLIDSIRVYIEEIV